MEDEDDIPIYDSDRLSRRIRFAHLTNPDLNGFWTEQEGLAAQDSPAVEIIRANRTAPPPTPMMTPLHIHNAQRMQETIEREAFENFSDREVSDPDVSQTRRDAAAAQWSAIAAQWTAISGEWAQITRMQRNTGRTGTGTGPHHTNLIQEDPWVLYRHIIASPYTQFFIVLLLKGIFVNYEKLLCLAFLLIAFPIADSLLKTEVGKETDRKRMAPLVLMIALGVCISYTLYEFQHQALHATFIFTNPRINLSSFWNVLWVACVSDYIAKLATIMIKAGLLCLPEWSSPFVNRGVYLAFMERTSQLYRSLIPILPWMYFYAKDYHSIHSHVIGLLLACTYGALKTYYLVGRGKKWMKSLQMICGKFQNGMRNPTEKEVLAAGPQCSICFESFKQPLRLECSHIYCQNCIRKWFAEERSCPICRSDVKDTDESDNNLYQNGTTSHAVQIF